MGANLGADVDRKPDPGNPHGHWEHMEVWTAQERLLTLLGRTWHESTGPLPPDWINWPETRDCITRFSAIARLELSENGHWVVKDPRSSLLLPLWKAVATLCETDLRLVRLLRHGGEVARSLARRNGMPTSKALAIWREHQNAISRDGQDLQTLTVHHADLMLDPLTTFRSIALFCGLPAPHYAVQKAADLVDPTLWHHRHAGPTYDPAADDTADPMSPQDQGRVLIVMRTRWRQHLLARAIRSVLSQTYTDWILHVVNDGGPSSLVENEIEPYLDLLGDRLKITHRTSQHGMEAASNWAIRSTESDFIVIHDDDDRWSPDFLARMTAFLQQTGAQAGIARSRIVHELWDGRTYVTQRKEAPLPVGDLITPSDLATANRFPPISFLFRRSVIDRIGGFHESLPALGDWHFNRRIAELAPIPVLPEVLAFWHHRSALDQAPNSLAGSDHMRFADWVRAGQHEQPLPPFFSQMQVVHRQFDEAALQGFERYRPTAETALTLRPGLYLINMAPNQGHQPVGQTLLRMQDSQGHEDILPVSLVDAPLSVLVNAPQGLADLKFEANAGGSETPRPQVDVNRLADPLDSLDAFSRQPRLPDLLCIGAQRSGTTWLHAALQTFPEVWPCPIKEFHQFHSDLPSDDVDAFRQHQALALLQSDFIKKAHPEARSARVRMLLRHAFTEVRSWDKYSSLFDGAPSDQIVCDFTPAYATLKDDEVAAIVQMMPDIKVVFILRDPVERSISGALHELYMQGVDRPTLDQVATRCLSQGNLGRTDYIRTLRIWEKHLPPHQFLVLFHDDILATPDHVLDQVREFLGLPERRIPSSVLADLPRNRHEFTEGPDLAPLRTRLSPRLRAQTKELAHRLGKPAQRWLDRIEAQCCISPSACAEATTGDEDRTTMTPKLSIAIVLHLFHEDQWPDFENALASVPKPFNLFVSLTPDSALAPQIRSRFPSANIRKVPNVGRDVAPFLALWDELRHFDLICKLHTKRSIGAHGTWRSQSLADLIGSTATVCAYLDAFAKDPDLVLAGPRRFYIDGPAHEMLCRTALYLMHGPIPENWGFFAGTMFWCRPRIFDDLPEIYPQEIFAPHHEGDGQPEHVVERLFGLLPAQQGKKVMLWDGTTIVALATAVRGHLDWAAIYAEMESSAQQFDTLSESSLVTLHKNKNGRISDKWHGNLQTYDRLLTEHRGKPIRFLEIGVQYGGSLELWANYFRQGRIFLGCDIDPNCGKLTFDDPRIDVFVCDAASPLILKEITARSGMLDLIIDDGSHRSGDVIQSFTLLFPLLANDGFYIVEDQHCSYWEEYDGGLSAPHSSLAFFRALTDLINHEHWRERIGMVEWLRPFVSRFGLTLTETLLRSVRSIEFSNSLVCIRKGTESDVRLGQRMVNGIVADVDERPRRLVTS